MSDKAVVLPPGEKPQVGKTDLDAAFAQISQAPKTYETLEYTFDLSEPEIIGSFAFEYGAIRGATRNLKDGSIEQSNYHVMRILRKEAGEEWKVYRTIWTTSG
jgi:ketosteroid isomerase-like protein